MIPSLTIEIIQKINNLFIKPNFQFVILTERINNLHLKFLFR